MSVPSHINVRTDTQTILPETHAAFPRYVSDGLVLRRLYRYLIAEPANTTPFETDARTRVHIHWQIDSGKHQVSKSLSLVFTSSATGFPVSFCVWHCKISTRLNFPGRKEEQTRSQNEN
jgi:hypothetical protein